MGSWIIVATFIITALYLIIRGRNFSPLPLLASLATALLLCLFGFLFTAACSALLAQIGTPIQDPIAQALLVSLGVALGVTGRHYWKRSIALKNLPATKK